MPIIHPYTGPKIRFYRELRGLTLRQLGKLSGVHYRTIDGYELRHTTPNYEKVGRIAAALGVTLELLWDHSLPPASPASRGDYLDSQQQAPDKIVQ